VNLRTREAWWKRIDQVTEFELTTEERLRLSELIQSSSFVKASAIVLSGVAGIGIGLVKAELSSQADINHACRYQGMATGLTKAIEMLGDLATEPMKEDQDG
jgi:hypothetical protein